MKWKIITDSGCDLRAMDNLPKDIAFESIPLKIMIENQEIVDDINCDIPAMMQLMAATKAQSSTACPAPEEWAEAFRDADCCIAITSSSGVSGSLNSARVARHMVLEEIPEKRICLFDSLTIGPEMVLLVEETIRLIGLNYNFDQVCEALNTYHSHTHLCFMLSCVDNLVKNGRLSRLAGATVNVLGIRLVGIASDKGTLKVLAKNRGLKHAIKEIKAVLHRCGFNEGKVIIANVINEIDAQAIANAILTDFPKTALRIIKSGGLCSYYAEKGGMLIGFEGAAL